MHLPSKHWRSLPIAIGLVIFIQGVEYFGWFASWNGRLFNYILANATSRSEQMGSRPIVVVEIDDQDRSRCFGPHPPLNASRVFNLVAATAAAQPKVIGVDILTDDETTMQIYQSKLASLSQLSPTVVWASGETSKPDKSFEPAFPAWLMGARNDFPVKPTRVLGVEPGELSEYPQITWAIPVYPTDEGTSIRRLPRWIWASADPQNSERREWERTWPRVIAEAFCNGPCTEEAADEIYITYGGTAPRCFLMRDLAACGEGDRVQTGNSSWNDFQSVAKGNIVLIGGIFHDSGDFHRTPLGLSTPGIIVNAYAVKAELLGNGLRDVRQPLAWMLDLLFGIVIIAFFNKETFRKLIGLKNPWLQTKPGMFLIGILFALAVCLASRWVAGGRYLLGFAGVSVGLLLHELWELLKKDE
ncbi:MAG: CHASE2 domain-containing protein [Acidobacteriaceae bacterium]|nr:CHASE2 domain-containing protein [Acidobacteriaceae bacterium]